VAAGKLKRWAGAMRHIFKPLLDKKQRTHISKVIAEVEKGTTGEIHVHMTGLAPKGDILDEARRTFHRLKMHETKHRNAVLVLVSPADRRFAIFGDEGIHSKAGQPLWDSAKAALSKYFKEGRYAEGVEACVRNIGKELAAHFPK
jgi:uncharacterized membrane protein